MFHFINDYLGFAAKYCENLNSLSCSSSPNDIYITFLSSEDSQSGGDCKGSPFAAAINMSPNQAQIIYDSTVINELNLSTDQQHACIAHECGHWLLGNTIDCHPEEIIPQELFCDKIAAKLGLVDPLVSALKAMNQGTRVYGCGRRINHLLSMTSSNNGRWLYRPIWTYGKYREDKKAAIYYNCLSGTSYFFEDDSAKAIGIILSLGRCGDITEAELAGSLGTSVSEISGFIDELISLSLVLDIEPTMKVREFYRQHCAKNIKHHMANLEVSSTEQSSMDISDAESLYSDHIGGVTSVMLELTYRCSEKCIHCYNFGAAHCEGETSNRGTIEELTVQEYKKIIEQLDELGVFRVTISGGDPFARGDNLAWEVMKGLYEKDIAFDLYTNGQQLYGQEVQLSRLFPKLVGVSIYSGSPDVHDSITRLPGSFERSVAVMKKLSSLSIPMYLKCCVIKQNFETYSSVFSLAEEVNAIPQIEINVFDGIDGNKYVSKNLRLSKNEIMSLLDDKRTLQSFDLPIVNHQRATRDMSKNACKAGLHTFNITPDGDVIPCCVFHLRFGNLRNKTFKEIINHSPERKEWLSKTLEDYEECGRHDYCSFCSLCPGHNYSEHGSPYKASENNCYMAKIKYEYALKKQSQG